LGLLFHPIIVFNFLFSFKPFLNVYPESRLDFSPLMQVLPDIAGNLNHPPGIYPFQIRIEIPDKFDELMTGSLSLTQI